VDCFSEERREGVPPRVVVFVDVVLASVEQVGIGVVAEHASGNLSLRTTALTKHVARTARFSAGFRPSLGANPSRSP